MVYNIKNAIIKKDNEGNLTLVDPENYFENKNVFLAIDSDDLISIQLLVNSIINNDFKIWNEIVNFKDSEDIKNLFIKLGYSKEDITNLLKTF